MKLSNGLKDALLQQLLLNFRSGLLGPNPRYGYHIRFFDSTQIGVSNPLNDKEFTSTYFQTANPVGMLLDFGVSVRIPTTAFTVNNRSLKLLGTYTETAKISGTADLACVFAVDNYPSSTSGMGNAKRIFITDSIVPNGLQGAFVLTQTTMIAGDAVTIADFTLNLIEP